MENLPLIFKRYTSENGGKELLGAVELRLELPGETDVRLGITAITFLVDWGDGESDHSAAHHYEQAGYYRAGGGYSYQSVGCIQMPSNRIEAG